MANLRNAHGRSEMLAGKSVPLKTPSVEMIRDPRQAGLDISVHDAEHAGPFDRARMDACLAVAPRARFPRILVRVPSAAPSDIFATLEAGAVGIVVPHVNRCRNPPPPIA